MSESLREAMAPFVRAESGIPSTFSDAHPAARICADGRRPGTMTTLTVGDLRALTRAFLEARHYDATALAEARAEGRRQGLEEAAKNDHSKDFQLMMVRIIQRHRNGRDLTETLEGAADLLKRKGSLSPFRSLATNTPETQKPETGESA